MILKHYQIGIKRAIFLKTDIWELSDLETFLYQVHFLNCPDWFGVIEPQFTFTYATNSVNFSDLELK